MFGSIRNMFGKIEQIDYFKFSQIKKQLKKQTNTVVTI